MIRWVGGALQEGDLLYLYILYLIHLFVFCYRMASNDVLTESDPLLQHIPQESELKSAVSSEVSDDCQISVFENSGGECPEPSLCLQVPSYVYIKLKSILSTKYVSLREEGTFGPQKFV